MSVINFLKYEIAKWFRLIAILIGLMCFVSGCNRRVKKELDVVATAFNSVAAQTYADHPEIGAWGDTLRPGMKCIAVSRDLIKLGLTHQTKVEIEGFKGKFRVLDKMNRRWEKRIDIYMGKDIVAALKWGREPVTIRWMGKPE